jgi:hypothetical protein
MRTVWALKVNVESDRQTKTEDGGNRPKLIVKVFRDQRLLVTQQNGIVSSILKTLFSIRKWGF